MDDGNRNHEGPGSQAEVRSDLDGMRLAMAAAAAVRCTTAPNPWVGAVVVSERGEMIATGATEAPGKRHAEIVALDAAGSRAIGSTLYVTLEPCSHHGLTPPCVEAIVESGVRRIVVGVEDPDARVSGAGIDRLQASGVEVTVGVGAELVVDQLRPYLHHRRTGRPFVLCKVAASLDGATAAADGTSQWITSDASRADGHRLRAESGAIVVGAGTVRTDDPSLTVRHVEGPDPLRIVVGSALPGARVHPCIEWTGALDELLDRLGEDGVLQVLVEGGSTLVRSFLDADLIDRFVVYVAPALFAGRDTAPMVGGPSAATIGDVWRGTFGAVDSIGPDLRIELVPRRRATRAADGPGAPSSRLARVEERLCSQG